MLVKFNYIFEFKEIFAIQVVEYNGERTLEGMSKFIETGGVYGQAAPDEVLNCMKNFICSSQSSAFL